MAAIQLNGVRRTAPDGTVLLDDVDLSVGRDELLGLIGPSGAGKSTLMRAIAGVDQIHSGVVGIAGVDMTRVGMRDRNVALVTDARRLRRLMSVVEELVLPAELRRLDDEDEATDPRWWARGRRGGRRTGRPPGPPAIPRRLMSRAMERMPTALLLDEPLAGLGPVEQRTLLEELASFRTATGITVVLATNHHWQVMRLADRVAVMRAGRIETVASPEELRRRPCSTFVAGFVGDPPRRFVDARVAESSGLGWLVVGAQRLRVPGGLPGPLRERLDTVVRLAASPDQLWLSRPEDSVDLRLAGTVESVVHRGSTDHVIVDVGSGRWTGRADPGTSPAAGAAVELTVAVRQLSAFDPTDGRAIWHDDGGPSPG